MKTHLFQAIKLSLILISSSVVAGGLYSVERAYGRAGQAPLPNTPISPHFTEARLPSPEVLHNERSPAPGGGVPQQVKTEANQLSAVEVCVDLPNWRRPSEQTQRKQLEEMERYSAFLQDETLISMIKDWWSHEVFSFTTYGLSARTDPHYLSGIWTALDNIWDCYSDEQPRQINNGDLAELWLINHQIIAIHWQDNQYIVTVEPTTTGLQLLQFERQENYDTLPITIMTANGEEIAVMSGDW